MNTLDEQVTIIRTCPECAGKGEVGQPYCQQRGEQIADDDP